MAFRTWNLRMNLDELNALVATMFTDFDRAQAFQGMVIGCNGGSIPEDTSKSLRTGFEVGSKWREEAEQFREKQRDGGKKSAESRAEKYGTPQPTPKSLQENPEVTSDISRTNRQSTIDNQLTKNQKPPKPPKGKKQPQWATAYPEAVVSATAEILSFWPKSGEGHHQPNTTQDVPNTVPALLAGRLAEMAEKTADMDICVAIARNFVSGWREGRNWLKAAQYFFGREEDAPFRAYYRAELTSRAMEQDEHEPAV